MASARGSTWSRTSCSRCAASIAQELIAPRPGGISRLGKLKSPPNASSLRTMSRRCYGPQLRARAWIKKCQHRSEIRGSEVGLSEPCLSTDRQRKSRSRSTATSVEPDGRRPAQRMRKPFRFRAVRDLRRPTPTRTSVKRQSREGRLGIERTRQFGYPGKRQSRTLRQNEDEFHIRARPTHLRRASRRY